jgi:hypothetical protein
VDTVRSSRAKAAVVGAGLLALACTPLEPFAPGHRTGSAITAEPVAPAGGCHARGALPDPSCTPGVLDPAVTQASIGSTICVLGWMDVVRPDLGYLDRIKARQMAAYGYRETNTGDYEEDHLVALEIGGDPRAPGNLWPLSLGAHPGARDKDRLERELHGLVCAGRLGLADVQSAVMTDWVAAYRRYVGPP